MTTTVSATVEPVGRLLSTELLLDLGGCDPAVLNPAALVDYTTQLIKLLKMKAYGKPIVNVEFGEGELRGWTLILVTQLITTSNITIHAWPEARGVSININSCGPYDPHAATEFTRTYFDVEPGMINATVVPRRVPTARN